MASKSKLLQRNKHKQFFQHGLVKKTDWRSWIETREKTNAINVCKNKK